jgi:hypothetical protein
MPPLQEKDTGAPPVRNQELVVNYIGAVIYLKSPRGIVVGWAGLQGNLATLAVCWREEPDWDVGIVNYITGRNRAGTGGK